MAIVAIVDTGINTQHLNLKDNLWINPEEIPGNGIDDDFNGLVDDIHGFDVITGQPISAIGDPEGHGTHVAGIVTQTSKSAEIMGVRLLDENGGGNISDAINAWSYALLKGATIINNSWGALGIEPSQVDFTTAVSSASPELKATVFCVDDQLFTRWLPTKTAPPLVLSSPPEPPLPPPLAHCWRCASSCGE